MALWSFIIWSIIFEISGKSVARRGEKSSESGYPSNNYSLFFLKLLLIADKRGVVIPNRGRPALSRASPESIYSWYLVFEEIISILTSLS